MSSLPGRMLIAACIASSGCAAVDYTVAPRDWAAASVRRENVPDTVFPARRADGRTVCFRFSEAQLDSTSPPGAALRFRGPAGKNRSLEGGIAATAFGSALVTTAATGYIPLGDFIPVPFPATISMGVLGGTDLLVGTILTAVGTRRFPGETSPDLCEEAQAPARAAPAPTPPEEGARDWVRGR
jgi:hypothetical protein